MDRVISSVLKTSAVKTLHLSFCRKNDDNHDELNLVRPSPWRSLLSQDVLLNLWSWLLAETKTWSGAEKSHTSRDIIVFLVKEKYDVLFQNIHRRRIRKRKRYGIEN